MALFKLLKVESLNGEESKYIKPLRMHYTLNDKSLTWDCMKVHDSVAAVMFNISRKKLIFVKQFRPAVYLASTHSNTDLDLAVKDSIQDSVKDSIQDSVKDSIKSNNKDSLGYTLECCAGIIDKQGKSTLEIVKEEILEETGYDVPISSIKFLSSFRSGVGVTGSLQHLYFCQVSDDQHVHKGGGVGDEQIDIIELSIEEAKKLLLCKDEEAMFSRPASMLFALSWFIYEYLPKNT